MGHNLNFNNGKHSFFSVKEKAWHGLGTILEECPTSEQAIKFAGLDYKVEKRPVHIGNPDGTTQIVEDAFATTRADNNVPFGIVGSRYEVLQNVEAFDFFDEIVGKNEAIYETAGALGKGETIFVTAKLPNYIRVGKDDLIEQYIFLTNNHNGNKLSEELGGIFNVMAKKAIVDQALKDLIVKTFATNDQLEKIAKNEEAGSRFESLISDCYTYAMTSDTQQMDTTKGTVFGAYNAITGYLQNVKEFKSGESQLTSLLEGSSFDYSQKAFDLCLAIAK